MPKLAWAPPIFLIVGGTTLIAWAAFHYVLDRPSDLLVCQGEREDECWHHTHFIDCDGSMELVAKKVCRQYDILPVAEFETKAGKCGNRTTRVLCKQ